jgi:hypothetical protein
MSELKWYPVSEVRLSEPLIPDPDNPTVRLAHITGGRVAVEGNFLHIDPWPAGTTTEHEIALVPSDKVVGVIRKAGGGKGSIGSAAMKREIA